MKCLKVFGIVFLSVATAIMCSSCRGAQKDTFIEDFTGELDKDKRPLDYVNEMLTVKGNESSEEETTRETSDKDNSKETAKETAIETTTKKSAEEKTTTKKPVEKTTAETITKEETTTKKTNNTTASTTQKPTTQNTTTQNTTTQNTTTQKPTTQKTTAQKTTTQKTTSKPTTSKEETTTQQQTTAQPQKVTYTVSVKNKSGMPMENVDVYVYADNTNKKLVEASSTNASGIVTFTLMQSNKYNVVLDSVPKGYQVSSGYGFSGTSASITLSSSVIKEEINSSLKVGDVMYDITVTAPDGTSYTLSEILKKKDMVVLNFWFATCSWCIKEFPCIDEAYAQYKGDIEVLAVNPFDSMSDITYVKNTYGLTFPMVSCDYGLATAFGVTGYPTTVVIDKNGIIRMVEPGSRTTVSYWEWLFEEYTN